MGAGRTHSEINMVAEQRRKGLHRPLGGCSDRRHPTLGLGVVASLGGGISKWGLEGEIDRDGRTSRFSPKANGLRGAGGTNSKNGGNNQ